MIGERSGQITVRRTINVRTYVIKNVTVGHCLWRRRVVRDGIKTILKVFCHLCFRKKMENERGTLICLRIQIYLL